MKKINIELEVDDDFEPGYCEECPLHYDDWYYDEDDGNDFNVRCVLGCYWEDCLLKEKYYG